MITNKARRRVFFGLQIPARIKDRLLKVKSEVPGAKWQRVEQMHITLLFLGDIDEDDVSAVCETARHAPGAAFELDVAGLDCFGQPLRPRNLWAGVRPTAPVVRLHDGLRDRMETLGLTVDSRAFHPHITLARFKPPSGSVQGLLAEYDQTVFGSFLADHFVLFDSQLRPSGSVYTVIERFSLPASVI